MQSSLTGRFFTITLIYLTVGMFFSSCSSMVFADDLTQDQFLLSGYPRGGAEFGYSVDIDGNYAVAGAYKDDVQVGGTMHDEAGKAWIIKKSDSKEFLSPPEDIIPTAPIKKIKINQIIAIIVIRPIAEERKLTKTETPSCPPSNPRGPNPLKPPSGDNLISASLFMVLVLLVVIKT